ncbi:ATP-dependent helicase [Bacillus sp. M6-12]|uniref:ATP-dependent helicase n=1 Tax=Bacillus sp. M6-12 TaxID=2054166 RepID=UPI0015E09A3C|nr:ATP-dependent helicase [Bacillus sp. M6-12]
MSEQKNIHSLIGDDGKISLHKLGLTLDDEQIEAVMMEYRNTLVKANAGAGKTRVLTSRVAYLLASGIPQHEIMLLTFTNKASREMLERVQAMLGGRKIRISGGTFHKIGGIFLRKYADSLGYKSNFTILDVDDAKSLIEEIRKPYLKEHGLKKSEFPEKKIIYHYGSSAINKNMSLDWINAEENRFAPHILWGIEEILREYEKRKKEANAMDFDDMIVNFGKLLDIPDVRKEISSQYKYILVDEYQDINHIQNKIIKGLNKGNNNLFVVGDANQAIYSWRGSDVSYIEGFHRQYLNAETLYITHNYRSDGEILKLAEHSINHNYEGKSKKTKINAFLPSENKPTLFKTQDDFKQAEYIAEQIHRYTRKGVAYEDMAILLRTNFLTRVLEKVLRQHGIPYKLLAGFSFFERKHVKDILAFLRFVENPKDETAFIRMAGLFDGLGEKTVEKLFAGFKGAGYEVEGLKKLKVTKRAKEGLDTMIAILEGIMNPFMTIEGMISHIVKEYYDAYLKRTEDDYNERKNDLEYLYETANGYDKLTDFLSEMILDEVVQEEQGDNVVTITTVHKSKGLEWDCVFLPYLNDAIFPSGRSMNQPEGIEEERRLFYVAVTRARKHLHMSYIEWQSMSYKPMYPSMFLQELLPVHYQTIK